MSTPASPSPASAPPASRANPVLWLVIALPALAVVASLSSFALAALHGDRELPASYHWEGGALDRDDTRRAAAAALGLRAELRIDTATQRCRVTLRGATPAALQLELTHPTDPRLDQRAQLRGTGGDYAGYCAPLPPAHWWVQLADEQGHWLLRGRADAASGAAAPFRATLP
jgi:uncharacterized protein